MTEALSLCKDKLKSSMRDPIIDGIRGIYRTACKNCKNSENIGYELHEFQKLLQSIINWNSNVVEEASNRVLKEVDGFEGLMSSIFVGEAKVLSKLKIIDDDKKIEFKVPLVTRFIHKVYENMAEKVFYQPELFDHTIDILPEIEENNRIIREFVDQSIDDTIIDLAPVKDVLDTILKRESDSESEHEEKVEERPRTVDSNKLSNSILPPLETSEPYQEPSYQEPSYQEQTPTFIEKPKLERTDSADVNPFKTPLSIPNTKPIIPYNPDSPKDDESDSDDDKTTRFRSISLSSDEGFGRKSSLDKSLFNYDSSDSEKSKKDDEKEYKDEDEKEYKDDEDYKDKDEKDEKDDEDSNSFAALDELLKDDNSRSDEYNFNQNSY